MARRLALVTGASAGIGAAFARALAARGHDLALTARRTDRLESLAAELRGQYAAETVVISADLAEAGAAQAILAGLPRGPDILVNNAGYGLPGTYAKTSWADQAAFIQVMVTAVAELCHRTLPAMQANRFGRILNVASLAGLLPGSRGHTLYGASKAFLVKMSQSLNVECAGTGVHVTALCPGFTYSEFHDVNGTRGQVSQMPKWMWMSAEEVVEAGLAGVEANRAIVVPGGASKAIATLGKLLPDDFALGLMRSQSARFRAE